MKSLDTPANGAPFGSDLWRAALEKYAGATHQTVILFDADARAVFGPVHPTPLFQLFDGAGYDPGIFIECARRCLAQTEKRPAVLVSQFHGLAVVGASLVLESKVVGAAVGGYAFADFSQVSEIQRLAQQSGIVFERVWDIARKQPPVPQQRLIVHGELLQVLGDALLRENYRTRQYEQAAAIINSSDDAISSEDLNGVTMSWNAGAERLFGYPASETIGKPLAGLIQPNGLENEQGILERVRRDEKIDHYETVYRRKDRSSIDVSLTASPIADAGGSIIGMSRIARDITERKRAESALRESESRYRTLFESTGTPYLVLAADAPRFTITDVNSAYLDVTMTRREALIGRGVFEVFPDNPDDPGAVGVRDLKASFERVLETGRPDAMAVLKYDIRRADGTFEERYWIPHNTPIFDGASEPAGIVHHAEDVTDYVRLRARGAEHDKQTERLEAEIVSAGVRLQEGNVRLRQSEARLAGQNEAFRAAMDGASLERSLGSLVNMAIAHAGGEARSAFYIASADKTELRHIVGMSEAYSRCVDGFKIGPDSLACGLAVHTGDPVITPDVTKEPRWKDWLWLAGQFKFRACWSFPIETAAGKVVGTFVLYYQEPREAGPRDLQFAASITHAAAIIISKDQESERRARAEEHRELLVNELNHRVKNTLAMVQSFASQTLRNAKSTAEARAIFDARLMALAKTHDVLTREHWGGADLNQVVSDAIAAYSEDGRTPRFQVSGPELRLQPKSALALSMALHELATNAVKHGALSNGTGRVEIEWRVSQDDQLRFHLRWIESGGPPVEKPRRRGFGSRLVEQGLAQDLGGEVRLDFERSGLLCMIDAPLAEVVVGDVQPA